MFRVSKLTDYGIVLMTYLAQHPALLHNAKDLTSHTRVSLPTVSKLLKKLAKSGLLISHRGAKGGYSLARPAAQITVAEMILALEGDFAMTECSHAAGTCSVEPWCGIRSNWQVLNAAINAALSDISLADMAKPLTATMIPLQALGRLKAGVKHE